MGASQWQLRTTAAALAAQYRVDGLWTDDTLGRLLDGHLAGRPGNEFRIWSRTRPWQGTIADVHGLARRVATGLRSKGVGPDDVVAFQLPNWVEAAGCFWGVAHLGAVVAPIVHFYGAKEVRFILRQSGARVLVTAARFGHVDHLAILEELRPELPELEHVVVVGDEPRPAWAEPFWVLAEIDAMAEPTSVDPDQPALVAYTSGTTADPKGVVHTHRSIVAEMRQLGAIQAVGDRPTLVGAPVGHAIGMLAGLLLPVLRGDPVHLIDVWDPAAVLDAMVEGDLTAGSGATYFLTSLLDAPEFGPDHLARMRYIGLGGSSVPTAVTERASSLGISVTRAYGSTEHPSTTGATHDEPAVARRGTDGRPLPGVELWLVDADGRPASIGRPGEILSRGPDLFAGYTDPALTERAVDAQGWYHTEDIGILDEAGWLTITDRVKDVIIRGGENVSAAEVEGVLLGLPGVVEAVAVAAPDPRLGEHVCAFLRLAPGAETPSLDDVRAHADRAGLSRVKWPEELRVVEDLPRTASGKVQKFVLREQLRDEADGP